MKEFGKFLGMFQDIWQRCYRWLLGWGLIKYCCEYFRMVQARKADFREREEIKRWCQNRVNTLDKRLSRISPYMGYRGALKRIIYKKNIRRQFVGRGSVLMFENAGNLNRRRFVVGGLRRGGGRMVAEVVDLGCVRKRKERLKSYRLAKQLVRRSKRLRNRIMAERMDAIFKLDHVDLNFRGRWIGYRER